MFDPIALRDVEVPGIHQFDDNRSIVQFRDVLNQQQRNQDVGIDFLRRRLIVAQKQNRIDYRNIRDRLGDGFDVVGFDVNHDRMDVSIRFEQFDGIQDVRDFVVFAKDDNRVFAFFRRRLKLQRSEILKRRCALLEHVGVVRRDDVQLVVVGIQRHRMVVRLQVVERIGVCRRIKLGAFRGHQFGVHFVEFGIKYRLRNQFSHQFVG